MVPRPPSPPRPTRWPTTCGRAPRLSASLCPSTLRSVSRLFRLRTSRPVSGKAFSRLSPRNVRGLCGAVYTCYEILCSLHSALHPSAFSGRDSGVDTDAAASPRGGLPLLGMAAFHGRVRSMHVHLLLCFFVVIWHASCLNRNRSRR